MDDQLECLLSVQSTCNTLRQELGYERPDVRAQVFHNVANFAEATAATLKLVDSWMSCRTTAPELSRKILPLKEPSETAASRISENIAVSAKLGFSVLAQFQIENCVTRLANEIAGGDVGRGFYRIARTLLQRLEMGDASEQEPKNGLRQATALEILDVPARIRNSMHSNGYHDFGSIGPVLVGGERYEFREGERVTCASVAHVAHAVEESLKVLKLICDSPRVQQLDYVEEPYTAELIAEQRETT